VSTLDKLGDETNDCKMYLEILGPSGGNVCCDMTAVKSVLLGMINRQIGLGGLLAGTHDFLAAVMSYYVLKTVSDSRKKSIPVVIALGFQWISLDYELCWRTCYCP
jgi:hypothetical protein